jgi:hypothetical protein
MMFYATAEVLPSGLSFTIPGWAIVVLILLASHGLMGWVWWFIGYEQGYDYGKNILYTDREKEVERRKDIRASGYSEGFDAGKKYEAAGMERAIDAAELRGMRTLRDKVLASLGMNPPDEEDDA